MNRKEFIRLASAFCLCMLQDKAIAGFEEIEKPQVAITFDDPNSYERPLLSARQRDEKILAALRGQENLQVALFVCGKRVDNPAGRDLLHAWNSAGHIIANHSYSHYYFHADTIDAAKFWADIRKGEELIRHLSGFERMFRFPFLKEGDTVVKRDTIRTFLREAGYRNAAVSIDASDWYIDQRLCARLEDNPQAETRAFGDYFTEHIWERANFYNALSHALLGRSVPHILLLHHNLLNALFLDDLLNSFTRKGWRLIDAATAFADPVYRMQPDVLPAGESLLWSLAKERGGFEARLRYPAEDGRYEKERMDALGL